MSGSTVFQRLLWKEYRVLRQLWAMCGLGGTLLMLMILAIGESSEHSRGYSSAFWMFMVWVPPVYVLAALATMFAGEREEGTLIWLTALSPRLPSVLSSRLLFVAMTGIALQAWYGLVAIALSQFDDPAYRPENDAQENLLMMSFLLVESLVFGVFWSLQTNRPLNAILYSAIMIVLVNSGAAMLIDFLGGRFSVIPNDGLDYAYGFWGWARCLLLVAVMAADWQLATRWLHGHPWDWEWVAQWLSRRRVKVATTTGTSMAVAVLPADATEPWQRAWQRLRWLEWQGIRSYAWIVLILTGLSCLSILIRIERQPPTLGFCMIYCWLSLSIAGLMAWHGENSQQRFRSLVRLGVAPYALWANKLVCWFAAAVCSTVVIVGATLFLWTVISTVWPHQHYNSLTQIYHHMASLPGWKDTIPVMGLTYANTFFVAFVASHLFRRTVIAFGMALVGSCLATAWMMMCFNYGLPAVVFLLPIPLWLLWISAGTLPAWWTERTSWRVTPPRAAVLVMQCLLPFALLGGAAGYRVWEVPTVPALDPSVQEINKPYSINAALSGSPQNTAAEWNRLVFLLQQLPAEPPAVEKANTFVGDLTLRFHAEALTHLGLSATEARETLVNTNREHLKEIRDQALKLQLLTLESARANQFRYLGYLPMLVYAAESALNAGETNESLHYLEAAARLTGMVQRFQSNTLNVPTQDPALRDTLAEMVRWAQHPKQTEAVLSQGLNLCAYELKYWQTQPEELYLLRNQEMDLADKTYWPWERARARKLVDVAYSNRLYYLLACQRNYLRPGQEATRKRLTPLRLTGQFPDPGTAAWQFLPVEYARYSDDNLVYGLDNYRTPLMHEAENRYRATLALMAVVGHRRIHGALPGSLWELKAYFRDPAAPVNESEPGRSDRTIYPLPLTAMNDVWSGSPFGYAPTGFPLSPPEFPEGSALTKPLLWTVEPAHYTVEIRNNTIYRWTNAWGFYSHNEIRSAENRDSQSWIFPIPPQEEEPPKKEE